MNEISKISLPVFLVDDELDFLQSASVTLRMSGFDVITCGNSSQVLSELSKQNIGVIMLDILMPGVKGTELLPEIKKAFPHIPIIMLTALNSVETAVECMRLGAFDYLLKPVEKNRLVSSVRKAMDLVDIRNENARLKESLLTKRLKRPDLFEEFVTQDAAMTTIFQYIEAIAPTSMPVLIIGETGVGKEMIAKIIHNTSGRTGEFVTVNIAGLDEAMVSDTLFGHEKGAFTGADSRRDGLVAKAFAGTLFLDEIGDLAREMQVKLLRLLEDKTYYPVGSDSMKHTNARVVVATNKDLGFMRKEGNFRNDLYYRLQSHQVDIPPLRNRPKDIPFLAEHFCRMASDELKKEKPGISKDLRALLCSYDFPGNVRELKNMIFDAVSMENTNTLSSSYVNGLLARNGHVQIQASNMVLSQYTSVKDWADSPQMPFLKEAENMLIDEALKRANNNQTIAAQLLGMTRSALNKRLSRGRK